MDTEDILQLLIGLVFLFIGFTKITKWWMRTNGALNILIGLLLIWMVVKRWKSHI